MLGLAAVAWVQRDSNRELLAKNEQIRDARDQALKSEQSALEANRQLASANTDLATARDRAQANEARARRMGYAANIASAAASLRAGDAPEARRRLELCEDDLRGWEWSRLKQVADSSLFATDLGSPVTAVAFGPAGRAIAAGTADGRVHVLDAETGEVVRVLEGHERGVTGLAFRPDGAVLASCSLDRTVRRWDPRSGEDLGVLARQRSYATSVAYSADGERLLVGWGDKLARVYDAETGAVERTLAGHQGPVACAAFGAGDRLIATASYDRTVRVWDADTGEAELTLRGHTLPVSFVAFSPDGLRLVSGSDEWASAGRETSDDALRLWDARTGELIGVQREHSNGVADARFTPDGLRVVSVSADRTVRVWELASGRTQTLLGHADGVDCVAVSPDGRRVVSGSRDSTLRAWDDGSSLDPQLRGHLRDVTAVAFRPDGARLATSARDGTVRVWDAATGLVLAVLRGHEDFVDDLAWTADGQRIVSCSKDHSVRTWDADTGASLSVFEDAVGEPATAIAVLPPGDRLAVGTADNRIVVLDAHGGERVTELDGGPSEEGVRQSIVSLAVSPDGKALLSGSADQSLRLWSTATWEPLHVPRTYSRPHATFDPAGERIALGTYQGRVRLLDAHTLEERALLSGHRGAVAGLAFGPDGSRLVSASADGTVRLWDPESGETLLTLSEEPSPADCVAFSPDGALLAAGFDGGGVRLWPSQPAAERFRARARAQAERVALLPAIDALFEELARPERVMERLRGDVSLTAGQRDLALRLVRLVSDDPRKIELECWDVLRLPGADEVDLHVALWSARAAASLEPEGERYPRLVGIALYRLGRYEQALGALERSQQMRSATYERARPDLLAFLAMTRHRLGKHEEALEAWRELRTLMQIPLFATQQDFQALLRETEWLLGVDEPAAGG